MIVRNVVKSDVTERSQGRGLRLANSSFGQRRNVPETECPAHRPVANFKS